MKPFGPNSPVIRLTLVQGGIDVVTMTIPKDNEPMIGREAASNDVVVHDPKVSRIHARLVRRTSQVLLQDLNSRLGSLVNGTRITSIHPLCSGDILQFGDTAFRITIAEWVYEEGGEATVDLNFCSNPDCGQLVEPSFQFCPRCGYTQT